MHLKVKYRVRQDASDRLGCKTTELRAAGNLPSSRILHPSFTPSIP